MIPDSTDIDDPDALLAAATKVVDPGNPIDVPHIESARYALETLRKRFSTMVKGKKIVGAKVARGLQKMLALTIERHESAPQTVCAGWEGPCPKLVVPPKWAFRSSVIRSRNGESWRCLACGVRKGNAAITPEQRSESGRKGQAALTPEQRSETARKRNAALTPEQRSEAKRKGNAALTPEQRSEIARKANAARTPEQRSEIMRKAWEIRRAKAAK